MIASCRATYFPTCERCEIWWDAGLADAFPNSFLTSQKVALALWHVNARSFGKRCSCEGGRLRPQHPSLALMRFGGPPHSSTLLRNLTYWPVGSQFSELCSNSGRFPGVFAVLRGVVGFDTFLRVHSCQSIFFSSPADSSWPGPVHGQWQCKTPGDLWLWQAPP